MTDTELGPGRKDDEDKDRWDLLPWPAVREVVKVLTYGAKKYAPWNWKRGIKYSRLYAASHRHQYAFWNGESIDKDSRCYHLACAICELLFLLTYELLGIYEEFDDRPCNHPQEMMGAMEQEKISEDLG